MERLTKETIGCFKFDLKDHKHEKGEFATYDAFFNYSMAVKRLGEYENTGLEPEEIEGLKNTCDQLFGINDSLVKANQAIGKDLAAYKETGLKPEDLKSNVDVDFARIIELLRADSEGRLVVLDEPRLPLIWGDDDHDTILCPNCGRDLMGGFELANACEVTMVQCPHCGQLIDGTKALTREEAEKVREGGNHG